MVSEWPLDGGITHYITLRKPEVRHHNKNITSIAGAAAKILFLLFRDISTGEMYVNTTE